MDNSKLIKTLFVVGVVLMIAGALDPMEGSVVIAIGSVITAFACYRKNDRHKKYFAIYSACIVLPVMYLFYISSLGGIGGDSGRSMWLGLPILLYPAAWLAAMITLIVRAFTKNKNPDYVS